tara:strand:+ start:856 stop:1308 length:453 start_codon:yes stop_codon:yes gene_type:complete
MSFRQVKSFDLSDYDYTETQEYEKLAEESAILKEIFHDIQIIVNQGADVLDEIEQKTENSITNTEKGNASLIKAVKSNKTRNTIMLVSASSLLGVCIGGPIGGGAAAGISTAVIGFATISSILSGAIIGAVTGAGTLGGISGMCYRVLKK